MKEFDDFTDSLGNNISIWARFLFAALPLKFLTDFIEQLYIHLRKVWIAHISCKIVQTDAQIVQRTIWASVFSAKKLFDIVKKGILYPEIFQLVGLFENNVAADRLSDMIASIILEDIKEYTRRINRELNLDSEHYGEITFQDGIAINPYKKCELLYVPKEILHEIP